jgi:hypothetical protein
MSITTIIIFHAAVFAEIKPGVLDGVATIDYLKSECPLLEAALNEVLRTTMANDLFAKLSSPWLLMRKSFIEGRHFRYAFANCGPENLRRLTSVANEYVSSRECPVGVVMCKPRSVLGSGVQF